MPEDRVRIEDGVFAGRPHFIIHTPTAVYYYDKAGGGLSRMIDQEGHDWISFWHTPWDEYPASAASSFRGIPNLVFRSADGGAGHPGHTQCVSELVGDTAIRSTSKSGRWQWEWTFLDDIARVEVQKVDTSHAYWFLYEGTPGGTFAPARQYFGTDTGGPRREQPDFFQGDKIFDHWRWAYFGHEDVDRVLFVAQEDVDAHLDTFSYLGHSDGGVAATDGMTVFGFGRADGAVPLIKEPQTFLVGFWEEAIVGAKTHEDLARHIRRLLDP